MDLNHRPLGYEPNELPDCSTPQNHPSVPLAFRQTLAHTPLAAFVYSKRMDIARRCIVAPHSKIRLKDRDPADTFGIKKSDDALQKVLLRLRDLQQLLYADQRYALLIVLQARDAGGKDGTISHVMSGVNPEGCQVKAFKVPSPEELAHDYLWRVHNAVPARGNIGIFNRSHYEDVLIVRVHQLVPKAVWARRYRQINDFERMLTENGVTILKFYLNISKEEQKRRLEQRLHDPTRNWKLTLSDFEERQHWDEYTEAYEDVLRKCSPSCAPWYVIPSDHKWFRNYVAAELIVKALDNMKLKYPAPTVDMNHVVITD